MGRRGRVWFVRRGVGGAVGKGSPPPAPDSIGARSGDVWAWAKGQKISTYGFNTHPLTGNKVVFWMGVYCVR